jgi:CcmD family protein
MYDFLSQNSLYVVLLIVLIVWVGIFAYIFRLDRKISNLERRIKQ